MTSDVFVDSTPLPYRWSQQTEERAQLFVPRQFLLSFDGLRFRWKFALANVREPLLGADFLGHRNLLVDVAHTGVHCS